MRQHQILRSPNSARSQELCELCRVLQIPKHSTCCYSLCPVTSLLLVRPKNERNPRNQLARRSETENDRPISKQQRQLFLQNVYEKTYRNVHLLFVQLLDIDCSLTTYTPWQFKAVVSTTVSAKRR